MFNFFNKKVEKKEFDEHKNAVQTALNKAKQDVLNISKWVDHLNSNDSELEESVSDINAELATIKEELEELKNTISLALNPKMFKQGQTVFNKQTAVYGVQNTVQTAVQTAFLERLSPSERALVMILLNTDMKLSYDDLGAMMGKDTATIRGQVNRIKQKSEGLIEEQIEKNNKKRLYIPDKIRQTLLKKVKVRVKKNKKKQ